MAAFLWRRRGRATIVVSALIAAIVVLMQVRYSSPALATSGTGASAYDVPTVVDTNPDPDIVETTIKAEPVTVDIGNGLMANVLTFNGTIPGPLFRLKVGDTVIVHFENHLAHATGIHWHGIELENASDGTPLSQEQVPPNGKFLYKFKVSRPGIFWYHPHHHSSTNQLFKGLYGPIVITDPNEAPLIASGVIPGASQTLMLALSDTTVCKAAGSNDTVTYDPSLPWVGGGSFPGQGGPTPKSLCEGAPDGSALDEDGNPRGSYIAGDVPNIQLPGGSGQVNEGQTVLTNGRNVGGRAGSPSAPGALAAGAETFNVQAGQGLRLQLGNTATTRFFRLRLTDSTGVQIPLVRIGGQGGLLDHAVVEGGVVSGFDFGYDSGEILLDPGDRADVVAAIPSSATGVLTLWTEDFKRHGTGFSLLPTVPVMHLNVTGSAGSTYTISNGTALRASTGDTVPALGAATATLLDPTTFSPALPGMSNQDIELTNKANTLGINLEKGEHDVGTPYTDATHPKSTRYAKVGDTLELTVTNETGAHHPFHLHGFSMQPLELTDNINGVPPDGGPDISPMTGPSYTFPYNEFRDNIDVPGGYTLRFRIRLDDRPLMDGTTSGGALGRWVFHCHIFFHATFGMISEFDVVDGDGNQRPYINADGVLLEGNAGDMLTMHGTYVDKDGDAVSLSASTGTITDDGDGKHWTWTSTASTSGFVYVTATDDSPAHNKDQVAFELKVNSPPVVTVSNASGDEGAAIAVHSTATDADNDPLTTVWSYAPASGVDAGAVCTFADASHLDTTIACTDDGTYTITMTANDGHNPPVSKNATLTVANAAPTLSITSPMSGALYIVGTTVPVVGAVTDPGSNDTQTCTFTWDGGGPTTVAAVAAGSCTRSNTFTAAGVYSVSVTATDDDGGTSAPQTVLIVIYDPNAGFVTGGGTIDSPAGAFVANPSLTGRPNFGFDAKYHKGDNVPSGETEFHFQEANFNFHVAAYEWLVVIPNKAQFRGTGTVNGGGNYGFLLTVVDSKAAGGGKLRLKVWDKSAGNAVVYDNVPGAPEDIDTANPQPIASGSIVVH